MHDRRRRPQALQAGRRDARRAERRPHPLLGRARGHREPRHQPRDRSRRKQFRNDATRIIDLAGGTPVFGTPTPEDAGANPDGNPDAEPLPLPNTAGDGVNDGDLFCSDQVQLADGRILAVGGTDYYNDPASPGHRPRRGRARGPEERRASSTPRPTVVPVGLDELRPLVPVARDAARRQAARGQRRQQARQADLPGPSVRLRHERQAARDLRPRDRRVDAAARVGQPLAAALPAAPPAAERPRLLRRRRPVVQPVRPGLRRGALEHRRHVRPGVEPLERPRRPRHLPRCSARVARPAAALERRPQRDPAAQQPAPRRPADPRRRPRPRVRASGARRSRSCCRWSPTRAATTPGRRSSPRADGQRAAAVTGHAPRHRPTAG